MIRPHIWCHFPSWQHYFIYNLYTQVKSELIDQFDARIKYVVALNTGNPFEEVKIMHFSMHLLGLYSHSTFGSINGTGNLPLACLLKFRFVISLATGPAEYHSLHVQLKIYKYII